MEKEKFDSALGQFGKNPDNLHDNEFEAAQDLYGKIRKLEQELAGQAEKFFKKDKVDIDLEELENFRNYLQELEKEIKEENLQDQKDMMQRLGEIEKQLYSILDVLSWPVEFAGQERIEEEKKAQDFLKKSFFELSQEVLNEEAAFSEKNTGQLASILSKLVLPVKRLEHTKREYGEEFSRMCQEWENNLKAEEIIDRSLELIKEGKGRFLYLDNLYPLLERNKEYAADKILDTISWRREDDFEQFWLLITLTDLVSAEEARKRINERVDKAQSEEEKNNLRYARSYFTPNHDKNAIENLENFYNEEIDFEEYDLNKKMNEKELSLLAELINKDDKVLEEGCGTGRLFLGMRGQGFDVTAFDFTPRHVEMIKEKDPEAPVYRGNWHQNSLPDQSFDKVYSLGRNILHDYTLPDQAKMFREAARVLKPGGRLIFDAPNRAKGNYAKLIEGYAREMEKRHIENFRYGTIYDSPNGENFATRYAPSYEDIENLAKLSGLKVVSYKNHEIKDFFEAESIEVDSNGCLSMKLETGDEDENIYYVLEKI